MDRSITTAMEQNEYSNLRAADILESHKYLAERGYEVERLLGSGSFGVVLLGKYIQSQKKVAIKLMYIYNDKQLLSFTQKFTLMKKVQSRYTVHVLDVLTDLENKQIFLVMNFEENGNLEEFILDNPDISDSQIITMFIEVLRGLQLFKKNNIVHGNLKPQNILLSSSSSPILVDFVLSTKSLGSQVQQKNKGGNLFYEAPEQRIEQKSQIESDWFSAGLILFRLCGNHEVTQTLQIRYGNFPDITELRHQNIVKVAFKMLATSPKDRASPEDVITELQKILQSLPHPQKPEIQRIQYGDGCYVGETDNNMPHGQGKYSWNDGDKYEGEWKDGKKHGQGKYFKNNGDRYLGEWKDEMQHGQGKQFWNDGEIYQGKWKDGKQNGQGKKFWKNGDRYEGEWKDGNGHGRGKFFKNNGDRYEGEWKDGKLHGQGEYFWNNGVRYEGEYKDGKQHGQGKYFWNKGDRYEGEWKDAMQHGQGKYFWNDGDRYEGEWKNGNKHGQGKFFQNNGDRYEGEWKDDMKQGQGKYFLNDGDTYEGKWLQGWIYGKGKKFDSKGQLIEEGVFEKGVLITNF